MPQLDSNHDAENEQEQHKKMLEELGARYNNQTPEERTTSGVVERMVGQDSKLTESWAMKRLNAIGWKLSKNPDPTATDLVDENGRKVEIKFRSGPRPDEPEGSPRFFFEKYTGYTTNAPKRSKTWIENPETYVTVFSDGSLWIKSYAKIREMMLNDEIKYNTHLSRHNTLGMLINHRALREHGLLEVVS